MPPYPVILNYNNLLCLLPASWLCLQTAKRVVYSGWLLVHRHTLNEPLANHHEQPFRRKFHERRLNTMNENQQIGAVCAQILIRVYPR
jgi:hypothetical protein